MDNQRLPRPKISTPLAALHVGKKQLEPIAQRHHTRIHVPLQLEGLRNHLDRPALQLRVLAGFEAQEEIAGVFGIDAECVDGTLGVRFRVGGQPAF